MEKQGKGTIQALPGMEVFRRHGRGRSCPRHFHWHYTLGVVMQGESGMLRGSEPCRLAPGSVFLLNPGDVHACIPQGAGFDYWGINIAPPAMETLCGVRRPRFMRHALTRLPVAELQASLDEVVCGKLAGALHAALRHWLTERGRAGEPPVRHGVVQRACDIMGRDYGKKLSIEDLARQAGTSRAGLLRLFARELQISPHQYLVQVRLEAARRLMRQGVPLAQAALGAGFADQSHLSRCFMRHMGMGAGCYRSAWIGKGGSSVC